MTQWREEDGYITIAVVGLTALMAAIVAGLLMLARPTALLTRLDVDEFHRQARIEAGLNMAAFLLFFAGEAPSAVDGRRLAVDGGAVGIEVSPETGRVDLNTSGSDLLRQVFAAAGGTSVTPDAFAARVLDWRDEDDDKTIEGAESFDYAAAGRFPPANGPFRSVADLRFLLGLSDDDRARVEPFLTTFNRDGSVDPKDAAGPVRAALFETGTIDKPEPLVASAEEDPPAPLPGAAADTMPAAFRVTIIDGVAAGRVERGAVVIIAPPVAGGGPYSLLEWHDLARPASSGLMRADPP